MNMIILFEFYLAVGGYCDEGSPLSGGWATSSNIFVLSDVPL